MQEHQGGSGRQIISPALFMLVVGLIFSLGAQKAPTGKSTATERAQPADPAPSTDSPSLSRELDDTVALLPWSYRNGKQAALESAREVCNQLLLETGFNVFLTKTATGTLPPRMPNNNASKKETSPFAHLLEDSRALLGQTITGPADASYVLPTVEQMSTIGRTLQTRYVLAGRAQWSTRNVWVGIANRAKSICTVDLLILDTDSKRLVLEARNVEGDSTENKNMYNSVTSVISLNPFPLVLPGSVTPQEQRAVAIATAKAMEPWLRTQRIRAALAQADLSSEADSDSVVKFSTLISPITDLQATLKVTGEDERQVAALDPEEARLFALHTINLDYKASNKLRLRAMAPKTGPSTLLVNEDTRSFAVGERSKGNRQDISNAPTRRLSLLDCCGLLTRDMFDYMRARFVRQEKLGETKTVVYDLSYWRADDTSYQRVWIDPARRFVLRREIYDRNSKLKAVYLYEQPTQVAENIWLPAHVEIQNAAHAKIATFTVGNVSVDKGIADNLFTTRE